MAGYNLYSLDWPKFTAMVERPTRTQLRELAEYLDTERSNWADALKKGDPILKWPADAKGLVPIVADRLPLPDWYSDLSPRGQAIWAHALWMACMNSKKMGLDVRAHGDIYFDVVELVWKRLGVRPNRPGNVAFSRFGAVPLRYQVPARSTEDFDWAMHSMHPPEEVRRMQDELGSIAPAVTAAKDEDLRPKYSKKQLQLLPMRAREREAADVRREFSEVLVPTVEWVAAKERLLFVSVDT
jgi:hypothetical protein